MLIRKHTIRRLRAAASKVFPGDEDYRAFLLNWDVHSTLDLTEAQAKEALATIDTLVRDRRKADQQAREAADASAADRISLQQEAYIHGLFTELKIPYGIRQFRFIERQIGCLKAPGWLSRTEAQKVITGLQQYRLYSKQKTPNK